MKRMILALIFFAAFPAVSAAMQVTFDCKVSSLSELSSTGMLETGARYQKEQVGSTFSVDRKTGAIRGGYFLNNHDAKSIRVINEPREGMFYVVSNYPGMISMVSYLFIANQIKEGLKPFTYTHAGRYVYTGLCQ